MKILFFLLLSIISGVQAFSQNKRKLANINFNLEKIRDFRINIDGGCGVYNNNEFSIPGENNAIFVINTAKKGFFAIRESKEYIYVDLIKEEQLRNSNTAEVFSGGGFTVTLITKLLNDRNKKLRVGKLKIRNNKKSISVTVFGEVDYTL